jgi:hypothetical protein
MSGYEGYHPKIEMDYGNIIAVIRTVKARSPFEAVKICDAVINSLIEERRRILTEDINLAKTYSESLTWPKATT